MDVVVSVPQLQDWLWQMKMMWTKILLDKTAVLWTSYVFFFRGKCTISQFPLIKSHQNHHFTELPPNDLLEHHHLVRWFFPLKHPYFVQGIFHHLLCVFPWFSHGFPMVFPSFLVDFPAMFDQHLLQPFSDTRFDQPLGGHRSTPGLPRHAVREALQSRSPMIGHWFIDGLPGFTYEKWWNSIANW